MKRFKTPFKMGTEKHEDIPQIAYKDLAPVDAIPDGDEYINALQWALKQPKVKNIALAGPYGSGKSSIIQTYLKRFKPKCIQISMATFVEGGPGSGESGNRIDIKPADIEEGILKQLFYKVDYHKIPQSRYRKLRKNSLKRIFACMSGIVLFVALFTFVFLPEEFQDIVNHVVEAGAKIGLPAIVSEVFMVAVMAGLTAVMTWIWRFVLSRFRIKEVQFPKDMGVACDGGDDSSVFKRNLDEIVYFFEETGYDVVFFEDLDRLETPSIFVQLRELNTLLNNYERIKKPIKFVYAIRDDIFCKEDRTKFFEFIIPVIPIINSTNSGEILKELIAKVAENDQKRECNISSEFIVAVSPYVSDMRVLLNIYNEFLVYRKTLGTDQKLDLSDELIMALIIFKNLYPKDFADVQMETGVVRRAFDDKMSFIATKRAEFQKEIDGYQETLDRIAMDTLENVKELKTAFLCAVTDWNGIAWTIEYPVNIPASSIMRDDFDFARLYYNRSVSVYYTPYSSSSSGHYTQPQYPSICENFICRWKYLKEAEAEKKEKFRQRIESINNNMYAISGWSLRKIVAEFGVEEVLSEGVRENKLLVFLLRNGYINEQYANYINYFKGNSITTSDMNFVLGVRNREPRGSHYALTKIEPVVSMLSVHEFEGEKAVYNFALLEYLLSNEQYNDKLYAFIRQLSDGTEESWKFIDEFIDCSQNVPRFIDLLSDCWSNMWANITLNPTLTYERQLRYLELICRYASTQAWINMDADRAVTNFFVTNSDILERLAAVPDERLIEIISTLEITFNELDTQNVSSQVKEFIFRNQRYELNHAMIYSIVEFECPELCDQLANKNYTCIIHSDYAPLIERVHQELKYYIENIMLVETNVNEDAEILVPLLDEIVDDIGLVERVIRHERFEVEDISRCCSKLWDTRKNEVHQVWDLMLQYHRVQASWKNVGVYWGAFHLTDALLEFIEKKGRELQQTDNSTITGEFVLEFIYAEENVDVFSRVLECFPGEKYDVDFTQLSEANVKAMLKRDQIIFSAGGYKALLQTYPRLCVDYVLNHQDEFLLMIDDVPMESIVLEGIIADQKSSEELIEKCLDAFAISHMNERIASLLCTTNHRYSVEVFESAWEKLTSKVYRKRLLAKNMSKMDDVLLKECFELLGEKYPELLNGKRHLVRIAATPEDEMIAEHLKQAGYISSYERKKEITYDEATETTREEVKIVCRVKKRKDL